MDKISRNKRSENMRRIKSQNTRPEMIVRRLCHALGYRYRLHQTNLPGKPDLVFSRRKAVVFVHGCFWHQHPCKDCADSRRPKSNTDFWNTKLDGNVERDAQTIAGLKEDGWNVLVVWECETRDVESLKVRIIKFLGSVRVS